MSLSAIEEIGNARDISWQARSSFVSHQSSLVNFPGLETPGYCHKHQASKLPLSTSQMDTIHLFLISGRSGSGKSTITYEVCHQLTQSKHDIRHIHIEADGLDFFHPDDSDVSSDDDIRPGKNMMLTNLRSIFGNFYHYHPRSCQIVLISGSGVILRWESIKRVVEEACRQVNRSREKEEGKGFGDPEIMMHGIILSTSDETATARLTKREIGTDLPRHLESSKRIDALLKEKFDNVNLTGMDVGRIRSDVDEVSVIAARIVEMIKTVIRSERGLGI
jgi:ABC-type dipeptide/oligopeptide/nickel transport system ATPase component